MPAFVMALIRSGLKSLLADALAQTLTDFDKEPSSVLSDEEIAKLTPRNRTDGFTSKGWSTPTLRSGG
jgi:hypothetical protein